MYGIRSIVKDLTEMVSITDFYAPNYVYVLFVVNTCDVCQWQTYYWCSRTIKIAYKYASTIVPFPCKKVMENLLHHGHHFGSHNCIGAYG